MKSPVSAPILIVFASLATPATAQDSTGSENVPVLVSEQCEMDLALSAAPTHLQADVTVFVLMENGYERVREGSSGFTCIVNRDHPRVLKPTCFDAEGSATIVPKILKYGELMMKGIPIAEVDRQIAADFESGRFISPRRPGIAYMFSHYNRPYSPSTDRLGWFPPHIMFYAPNMTNNDIGVTFPARREDPRLPMVAYGGPQGFMITMVESEARPQDHPMNNCPAWVSANPPGR